MVETPLRQRGRTRIYTPTRARPLAEGKSPLLLLNRSSKCGSNLATCIWPQSGSEMKYREFRPSGVPSLAFNSVSANGSSKDQPACLRPAEAMHDG